MSFLKLSSRATPIYATNYGRIAYPLTLSYPDSSCFPLPPPLSVQVNCERLTRYPMLALAAWVSLSVCIIFLWTLFRLLTWKPKLEWLRVVRPF